MSAGVSHRRYLCCCCFSSSSNSWVHPHWFSLSLCNNSCCQCASGLLIAIPLTLSLCQLGMWVRLFFSPFLSLDSISITLTRTQLKCGYLNWYPSFPILSPSQTSRHTGCTLASNVCLLFLTSFAPLSLSLSLSLSLFLFISFSLFLLFSYQLPFQQTQLWCESIFHTYSVS